ncbi:MAG: methionine ABC transporter ATP-binding protein, partial [Firmicutes bacterium]|nr:methionine ABC transporter ATP-binding protein [Bacillota bacterium]
FNLLMQRNALGNVLFPLEISNVPKDKAVEKAKELLKLVDLEDRMYSYPKQLSGGQKQRVAIARALATNPKVLLCDEATSALDPKTTRSILSLLKEINQKLGITIIVITHEMKVIEEICTRVAIIDESKIAEIGDVKDIFTHPKSPAAKRLVYPEGEKIPENFDESTHYLRIIFDGRSSYEPILANMILDCNETVNIFYANSRNIDGNAVGEIVIQLPNDAQRAEKIKNYLEGKGINIEVFDNFTDREEGDINA